MPGILAATSAGRHLDVHARAGVDVAEQLGEALALAVHFGGGVAELSGVERVRSFDRSTRSWRRARLAKTSSNAAGEAGSSGVGHAWCGVGWTGGRCATRSIEFRRVGFIAFAFHGLAGRTGQLAERLLFGCDDRLRPAALRRGLRVRWRSSTT